MGDSVGAAPHMSDDAIRDGSGRTWTEWVELLDAWGASEKSHTDIARHLVDLGMDGWWAQSVTVGYERIKGLREAGQGRDGRYSGSASKTFPIPLEILFAALTEDAVRDRWLEPGTLSVRTSQPGKSARFDSAHGIVAAWFTAKGDSKASVQVQVEGLASREGVDAFRAAWKSRLAALGAYLETEAAAP